MLAHDTGRPVQTRHPGFWRGAIWLVLALFIALPVLYKPTLHGLDGVGYYVWLRSLVIDGDFNVDNEFRDLRVSEEHGYYDIILPTGYRYNQWAVAPALLWSPLYLPTHGLLSATGGLGGRFMVDGYSLPYTTAASLASMLFGFAGVLLVYDVARRLASQRVAVLAILTGWFASPLLFYMFSNPFMSHAVDFFANALLVWAWTRTARSTTELGWFVRGLCLGLVAAIRVQNLVLLILPAVDWALLLWHRQTPLSRRLAAVFRSALALTAGIAMFVLPQLWFWNEVYGSWFTTSYTLTNDVADITLDLSRPHLFELAFSNNHGLFVWSPVLLLAIPGLALLYRHNWPFALFLTLNLAVQFYFVGSLSTWHGAGPSFGARYLVGALPAAFLGLVVFVAWANRHVRFRVLAVAGAGVIAWNLLLIVQYALETIPRGGPMDVGQMILNQFTVIPQNASRIVSALITRR